MAIENPAFLDDYPTETSIYSGDFSLPRLITLPKGINLLSSNMFP
jgi:hypothetical protein